MLQDKKRVISGSICLIRNKHIWHANLFVSTRNDTFNTTYLTHITNNIHFILDLLNNFYIKPIF